MMTLLNLYSILMGAYVNHIYSTALTSRYLFLQV